MKTLITAFDLRSRASGDGRFYRLVSNPLLRGGVALLALGPSLIVFNLVFGGLIDRESRWTSWTGDLAAVFIVALAIVCYRFVVRSVERRPAAEVGLRGSVAESAAGFFLGVVLVLVTLAPILVCGSYAVETSNPATILVHALMVFGLLAFFEELIFRGVLLRLIEESFGTWIAIAAVAVAFGGIHLIHDESTLLSSAAIAVQDLVLSGAFVLTRKVWLSWGIHWGWNFAQDGVLGMPNSSVDVLPSWLIPEVFGPAWLTGGVFGIELSVVAIIVNVAAGAILMVLAYRCKQVQPRYFGGWRTRPPSEADRSS